MTPRALARPVAIATMVVLTASTAYSHVVSDREVRLLRSLPSGLVKRAAAADSPDSIGLASPNRAAWRDVYHQHGALLLFMDGAARGDTAQAETAWKAIDAAFIRQTPTGDFEPRESPSPESRLVHVSGVAVWLAELCRAEVVVMNSPLQDRFRWRIALMLPKLRRSIDWLAATADELGRLHAGRPDLLLADAQAFLLADGIFHEPVLNQLGQRSLVGALKAQHRNGAFWRGGDPSTGCQARALASLLEITIYFPAPSLEDAAARGSAWLERHVGRDKSSLRKPGEGSAAEPSARVAARDAIFALEYQAQYSGDARAQKAVARLADDLTR